jgi:hypothetical protein
MNRVSQNSIGVAIGGGIVAMSSFFESPSIILPSGAAGGLITNLFPGILTDVTDIHFSGQGIETESPGIAKPLSPDFIEG